MITTMKSARGMSLIEVLFSMFFISTAVLGAAALFDLGLRTQTKIEQRLVATNIATSQMDRLRAWTSNPDNFNSWGIAEGVDRQAHEDPNYTYRITSELYEQHSPCSRISLMGGSGGRLMSSSARKVQLEVAWGPGAMDRVRLISLIAAPPVRIAAVQVSGTPGTLGPDATADFQARAVDSGGRPIPDVFFHWSVKPGSANGTVSESADGRTGTFTHLYLIPPDTRIYYPTGSTCAVAARARFLGSEVEAVSSTITVSSP